MFARRQAKSLEQSKNIAKKSDPITANKFASLGKSTSGARLQRTMGNQSLQLAPKKPIPAEAITSDKLPKGKSEDKSVFMRKVYDAQLVYSVATKEFFAGLPEAQLGEVEGSYKLRKNAAQACKALLSQARIDLANQQKANDPQAIQAKTIGLASAYRSLPHDFRAWQDAFETAYQQTAAKRQALIDGEHSEAAVKLLVKDMRNRKAIPGFSNHSKGLAVDFATTEGKTSLGPHKAQAAGWRKSWFYNWLLTHAATYKFKQLATEEWHWDYQAEGKENPSSSGHADVKQ